MGLELLEGIEKLSDSRGLRRINETTNELIRLTKGGDLYAITKLIATAKPEEVDYGALMFAAAQRDCAPGFRELFFTWCFDESNFCHQKFADSLNYDDYRSLVSIGIDKYYYLTLLEMLIISQDKTCVQMLLNSAKKHKKHMNFDNALHVCIAFCKNGDFIDDPIFNTEILKLLLSDENPFQQECVGIITSAFRYSSLIGLDLGELAARIGNVAALELLFAAGMPYSWEFRSPSVFASAVEFGNIKSMEWFVGPKNPMQEIVLNEIRNDEPYNNHHLVARIGKDYLFRCLISKRYPHAFLLLNNGARFHLASFFEDILWRDGTGTSEREFTIIAFFLVFASEQFSNEDTSCLKKFVKDARNRENLLESIDTLLKHPSIIESPEMIVRSFDFLENVGILRDGSINPKAKFYKLFSSTSFFNRNAIVNPMLASMHQNLLLIPCIASNNAEDEKAEIPQNLSRHFNANHSGIFFHDPKLAERLREQQLILDRIKCRCNESNLIDNPLFSHTYGYKKIRAILNYYDNAVLDKYAPSDQLQKISGWNNSIYGVLNLGLEKIAKTDNGKSLVDDVELQELYKDLKALCENLHVQHLASNGITHCFC